MQHICSSAPSPRLAPGTALHSFLGVGTARAPPAPASGCRAAQTGPGLRGGRWGGLQGPGWPARPAPGLGAPGMGDGGRRGGRGSPWRMRGRKSRPCQPQDLFESQPRDRQKTLHPRVCASWRGMGGQPPARGTGWQSLAWPQKEQAARWSLCGAFVQRRTLNKGLVFNGHRVPCCPSLRARPAVAPHPQVLGRRGHSAALGSAGRLPPGGDRGAGGEREARGVSHCQSGCGHGTKEGPRLDPESRARVSVWVSPALCPPFTAVEGPSWHW